MRIINCITIREQKNKLMNRNNNDMFSIYFISGQILDKSGWFKSSFGKFLSCWNFGHCNWNSFSFIRFLWILWSLSRFKMDAHLVCTFWSFIQYYTYIYIITTKERTLFNWANMKWISCINHLGSQPFWDVCWYVNVLWLDLHGDIRIEMNLKNLSIKSTRP